MFSIKVTAQQLTLFVHPLNHSDISSFVFMLSFSSPFGTAVALPNTYYVEKSGKSVAEHLELQGYGVLNHTLVLPKCGVWQEAYTTIGEYMEKRGKGSLLDCGKKCGTRSHILNNRRHHNGCSTGRKMENPAQVRQSRVGQWRDGEEGDNEEFHSVLQGPTTSSWWSALTSLSPAPT